MMKKFLLLLVLLISITGFSQDFQENWKKVVELEKEGKTKLALEEIDKIHKIAKKKRNEPEVIKTFFFKSKYLMQIDEEAKSKIVKNLKIEKNQLSTTSKAILEYIYAECLSIYLNQNHYRISQRTAVDSTADSDFKTWSIATFNSEIENAYERSTNEPQLLQKVPLENYEIIFDFEKLQYIEEKTVLDFVLEKKIAYYENKIESDFSVSDQEIGSKLAFNSPSSKISESTKFEDKNLSKLFNLYRYYEDKSKNKDIPLQRARFVYSRSKSVFDQYIGFLNKFQSQQTNAEAIQNVQLEKAIAFNNKASVLTFRNAKKIAVQILDSILSVKNRSNAYKAAFLLKEHTIQKSLHTQFKSVVYEQENSKAIISSTNVDSVKILLYKVPISLVLTKRPQQIIDSIVSNIIKLKTPSHVLNISLHNDKSYLESSTEILMPKLNLGNYIIYIQCNEIEENGKDPIKHSIISCTNLMFLNYDNHESVYLEVYDRKTGKPLEKINVSLDSLNAMTDTSGKVSFVKPKLEKANYKQSTYFVTTKTDTLSYSFNRNRATRVENTKENSQGEINILLDRSIYRPGQIVYGKGIIRLVKDGISSIMPNTSVTLEIKDSKYKTFKEFTLISNDFGSFTFEFELPKNILTGDFSIDADEPKDYSSDKSYDMKKDAHPFWDSMILENTNTYFSVEEYKRPTFDVSFDAVKESYHLNQNIKVSGKGKSFSGSNISNAKVKYSISRTFFNANFGNSNSELIASGETLTDAEGGFAINFDALPKSNVLKDELPIFTYEVKAEITDLNGETRSSETSVKVGYHTLLLSTVVPKAIDIAQKNKLLINSQNLNGEFVPTHGKISVYFLSPLKNKFKKSYLLPANSSQISDNEFENLFPYEDRKNKKSKEEELLVYSKEVNTEIDKEISLNFLSKLKLGNYKVVFEAIDKFENLVKEESKFTLENENSVTGNLLFKLKQLNEQPTKDGFVTIKILSSVPTLYMQVGGYYSKLKIYEKTIMLKNGQAIIKVPVKKFYAENITLHFESVFDNDFFEQEMPIKIKKPAENLEIEMLSYRNKLEPGATENWSFRITQMNKNVEAELLASMYDASLDQFRTSYWEEFSKKTVSNYPVYKNHSDYNSTLLILKETQYFPNFTYSRKKPELLWFGFDFLSTSRTYRNEIYYNNITKSKVPKNTKTVYGIVTEISGLPLSGALITIEGTSRSTQADFDGYYEIEALDSEKLVVEFIGMISQTNTVTSKEMNFTLLDDTMTIDAVVVEAFRSTKRAKSNVASTTVSSKTIENRPNSSFLQTLMRQIPGLEISVGSGAFGANESIVLRGYGSKNGKNEPLYVIDGVPLSEENFKALAVNSIMEVSVLKDAAATSIYGNRGANGVIIITTKKAIEELSKIQTRKNFNETAFFYPQLRTDKDGKITFNFTSPEALTQWKLRLFAHDKKANTGYFEHTLVTQKDLMITPNLPRFLREKDSITITTKISNLTDEANSGMAMLQLFDAVSMESLDEKMLNLDNTKSFTITPKGNTSVTWKIYVPEGLQGVLYKIVAKAGNFSDGEENILPVLTNNMLVTESIPVWVRENSTKEYTFENLKNNTSTTLRNQQLTFEYTSNPTWLAIQSLPYLMEYEHECAEQTFARYYANALASEILNSNPKIAEVFESWKRSDKPVSKLQQNEELKSVLLAEMPWIVEAQNEEEKKKNIATLFDLQKMKDSQKAILEKLAKKQKTSGGFAWFDDGEESEYITRHIISGLGHLQKLSKNATGDFDQITKSGISFLDQKFMENYKKTVADNKSKKLIWIFPYSNLHYLYARSFYLEKYPLAPTTLEITKKYTNKIEENWLNYSLYEKALASLVLSRFGEKKSAKIILESLRRTSSTNENWGMYWIENKSGWYWYQAPIETQALLIEAFDEIENDKKSVDAMKVWLLKNKQNKNWPTTKATTEAVYALLMQGTDWISVKDKTIIRLGDEKITTKKLAENEKEAGTGYIKMNWKSDEITKEMATVFIDNKSEVTGFGGFYWQYFEDLDKIKLSQESPMTIEKELYLKATKSEGKQLQRITDAKPLKIGDLVTVRLVISSKENMEFVHLKDMRASCFEPIDVLSKYKWQDGLGYYQSTKDVATHFFFDKIKKGKFVLEYDIRVNNLGDFSNGITTIQSMYTPEFSSHTKGIRVKIKE
jgi:TonB-dependent SusC/RagA subfamily outer membrane receptor